MVGADTPVTRLALLIGAVLSVVTGCHFHPYAKHPCERPDLTGCVVEKVTLTGNEALGDSDIRDKIATAQSDHTLGGALENVPILSLWDRLTVDYETLDPFVLQRDLARVERLYRVKGYYDAHARAARVIKVGKERLRVEIAVDEGDPVLVETVTPEFVGDAPSGATEQLVKHLLRGDKVGEPFDEDKFEATKRKLRRALTDNAFAYAEVTAHADVDVIQRKAKLVYKITTGPPCTFGEVTLDGYGDLPADKLRQAIHIQPGQPYSTDRIESAQNAVGDLRVTASVTAEPMLSKEGEPKPVIPIVFHVTETTLKTVKSGVGAEVGSVVETHGVAGWEHRNFLGGLRHFVVEVKPGVIISPLTFSTIFSKPVSPIRPLFEIRTSAVLDQPGFIEARTKGSVSISASMYQPETEYGTTLGYLELAGKTGISRDFWQKQVSATLSLNIQFDQPLQLENYTAIDQAQGYHRIVIPYVQVGGVLDFRKGADGKRDSVNPHSGFYLANDTQVAFLDSEDLRWKPEMRGYIPVGRKTTIALRAAAGFLYAFGGDLSKTPSPSCPFTSAPQFPCVEAPLASGVGVDRARYIQVMQLRGFTSGGPTSNRGYAYSGVGPQEVLPALTQVNSNGLLAPIATGGAGLWEASVELRYPIYDKLGGVVFLDGSDVRLNGWSQMGAPFAPHLSSGLGLRYMTPVGPFRADLGVRIPGAQVIGKPASCPVYDPSLPYPQCLSAQYGQASPIGSNVPLTISLAIGEAY
jgi:outer membrane protein insertion porin family/translocation and assembly module TamA